MTVEDDVLDLVGVEDEPEQVFTALARFGQDPLRAARAILQRRRAELAAEPAKWGVDGDYRQETVENLRVLDAQIAELTDRIGDGPAPDDGLPPLTATPIKGPSLRR